MANPTADRRDALTIAERAREFGITSGALRFYEAKGSLSPERRGLERRYGPTERQRLALLLHAKALDFTLAEIRQMLGAPDVVSTLDISRRQCFEQIRHLEQRKREIEAALAQLRRIYSSLLRPDRPRRLSGGSPLNLPLNGA